MKNIRRFFYVLLLMAFTGCGYARHIHQTPASVGVEKPKPTMQFRATVAAVDVTPPYNVWLAGYHPGRKSTGVHDPIEARILLLQDTGGRNIAIVTIDMLGFLKGDVDALRARLRIKNIEVFVLSSHNHSSPDLVGIYGPSIWRVPLLSGRDERYITSAIDTIAQTIELSISSLVPVAISFARSTPTITESDVEEPDNDFDVWNIQKITVDGTLVPMAVMVVAGCHPTTLIKPNTLLTSDFPGVMRDVVDHALNTTTLFINSVPGAVTYGKASRKYSGFERRADVGNIFAQVTQETIQKARPIVPAPFRMVTMYPVVPLKNPLFFFGGLLGYIPNDGWFSRRTEVSALTIGDITVVTIPGELFPSLAREIKNSSKGTVEIWSLANDEIGYIFRKEDFYKPAFTYWRNVSLGSDTGPIILENAKHVIKAVQH